MARGDGEVVDAEVDGDFLGVQAVSQEPEYVLFVPGQPTQRGLVWARSRRSRWPHPAEEQATPIRKRERAPGGG